MSWLKTNPVPHKCYLPRYPYWRKPKGPGSLWHCNCGQIWEMFKIDEKGLDNSYMWREYNE
jgi:hypothetical protein